MRLVAGGQVAVGPGPDAVPGRGVGRGALCARGEVSTHAALPAETLAFVSAEIRPDCEGAPGGEEAGAGLPPVPPEPEQRGLQRHRLPPLLFFPGVPAKVAFRAQGGLARHSFSHSGRAHRWAGAEGAGKQGCG